MENGEAAEVADDQDGARLLARGVAIKLKDGSHVLKFDYEALELIEEEFEGIDQFMVAIAESRYGKSRLKNIRLAVTAGMIHEKPAEQSLTEFYAFVRKNLDPHGLIDYLDAMTVAIMEAFPPPTQADRAPKAKGRRDGSPGNGSTGLPRSASGARRRSSGG